MTFTSWFVWALILFFQNISFTYVSRARSSGSLFRHLKASIFSNGIWIFSQMIMLGPMFAYLTGKHGRAAALGTAAVYTVSTVSGSLFAHYWALKTEKGKTAVGASRLYAQVPVLEWQAVRAAVLGDTPQVDIVIGPVASSINDDFKKAKAARVEVLKKVEKTEAASAGG